MVQELVLALELDLALELVQDMELALEIMDRHIMDKEQEHQVLMDQVMDLQDMDLDNVIHKDIHVDMVMLQGRNH